MSPSAVSFPRIGIEVEVEEWETVSFTTHRVPDPNWRFVDTFGHGHFWRFHSKKPSDIPTCELVVTGTTWVGDEFDGEEVQIKEWRCRQCEQTIEPGMKNETPKPILGPPRVTVTINGERFFVNEIEYAAAVDQFARALREITGRTGDITFHKTDD